MKILMMFVAAFALVSVVMGLYFIVSRKHGQGLEAALREALAWGFFFMLFAGVDYLMIVPGSNYALVPT